MNQRTRKLVGTIVIIVFVMVYGPIAMTLADSRISQLPGLLQAVVYALLGFAWIIPVLPLIKWMQKPDPDQA